MERQEQFIEQAELKRRHGDVLIFEKGGQEYRSSNRTQYKNDARNIEPRRIAEGSVGNLTLVDGEITNVVVKKIIARKDSAVEIICYAQARTPLSDYIASVKLPKPNVAYLKLVEAKCPFLRKVAPRKRFQTAFGLGLLEHYARTPEELAQFAASAGGVSLFVEFCKHSNKPEWIKSKHNSQALHLELTPYIEATVEMELLKRDSRDVREELNAFKETAALPSERILRALAKVFNVNLTVYRLDMLEPLKFKHSLEKRETIYILAATDDNYLLLTSRAQVAAEDSVVPRQRPEKYVGPDNVWHSLKGRTQALTVLATAVTQFITAALKAIHRWKSLAPLTPAYNSKLSNEFLQSQNSLQELFPQADDQELAAARELVHSDSVFRAISDLSKPCSKCGRPESAVDFGCHQICKVCIDIGLDLALFEKQHKNLFKCPKRDCETRIFPSGLRAAIGLKQFQKLQQKRVSAEDRSYQCSMCFRSGSYGDIYDLDCECNLCVICVGECIDKGEMCVCGKPLPEEVKSYALQWKARCERCGEEKVVKGHFVRMECMGHWMCCHCANEEIKETTPVCPNCFQPFPPHIQASIQFELSHATCSICHNQCAVAETVETCCVCVICTLCAINQEAVTQCPKCLEPSLTHAGIGQMTELHRRKHYHRR